MIALPPALLTSDGIHAHDHVASRLVASGGDEGLPFITVALPTFRRPDLLVEAVESILRQDFTRKVEILVVDNDPDSKGAEQLLAALPELSSRSFRYYVNAENIGMYPNHNRCIKLARGEWFSILNDDDLLRSDCLKVLFQSIDANPAIQAIGGRKQRIDEREFATTITPAPRWRLLAYAAVTELDFRRKPYRRIRPDKFFWGNMMDNAAGFVCRHDVVTSLGGFSLDEEWSADTGFYLRVAASVGLYQHRERLGIVRVRHNESMRPEVLRSFLRQGVRFRSKMIGSVTPRWWRVFERLALAEERKATIDYWGVDLPAKEVERDVGLPVVAARPTLFRVFRIFLGGF